MKHVLPPSLFAATATAMVIASMFLPRPALIVGPPRLTGLIFGAVGLGMAFAGSSQFRRLGTNIKTFDDPEVLVTDGLFGRSRNPMYLGFVLALCGLAVGLGTATSFLGPVLFFVVADRVYVRFEEQRMRETFGEEFDRYQRRVRRWFGRQSVGGHADEGLPGAQRAR